MIRADEKLRQMSDKVFVEAEPPSDRSRPLEWRRSINSLNVTVTSLVIKEHHSVNECDFFSNSMLSSGLKPANEPDDPEYEKEIIKPKTELRTIISSRIDLSKIRDALYRTVEVDKEEKIYSVAIARGYLDLSINDDPPRKEAAGIFAKGAQNGFAWIEDDEDKLTISVSIGKEVFKHLIFEIKSGRVSKLELSIAIDSFSYEVDDFLREWYHARDLIIHGRMAHAAIENFSIVSNEFLQKNGDPNTLNQLDSDDSVDLEHQFEPEYQPQIYQPQINNVIDPEFLKSIKTALWAIAIILFCIWWNGKK
jgi:hypothetical protein